MKVLVAMSGGVDSTIAAYLLQKQGNEVIGVNFNFVGTNTCGALNCDPTLDEIAKKLNIKIIYRDFRKEFHDKVITSFVRDYECGITPNPCALCNGIMKFEKLLQVMKEENCDMIATGHYANVVTVGTSEAVGANAICKEVGAMHCEPTVVGASYASPTIRYCIKKSKNEQKDQSYMLYRLNQDQLSHIVFPIGDMDKNEVRRFAAELGLSVANKKDSQDVCFIKDISYKEFIKRFEFGDDYKEKIAQGELKETDISTLPYFRKGEFVDIDGNVLGFHEGIINYTIGQRRGINIAFGERKFVVKIDAKNNQVVLGDNSDLLSSEFQIYDIVYSGMTEDELKKGNKRLFAKLRYRHDGTECTMVVENVNNIGANINTIGANAGGAHTCMGELSEPTMCVKLVSPVRAITRGQSAVFYDENDCIMFGGRIL